MSKRKRPKESPATEQAAAPEESKPVDLPPPAPPQPNLPLLIAAGVLYAAFVGFLAWMALGK